MSQDGTQRLVTTISEGMGWMVDDRGDPVRNPLVVADFEREVAMSPHGVFKAAQMPDAKAVVADELGPGGKVYTAVTFTAAGSRIKATLNEIGLVIRAESLPGDPITSSAPAVIAYGDYRDVDGIKFPFRITQTRGTAFGLTSPWPRSSRMPASTRSPRPASGSASRQPLGGPPPGPTLSQPVLQWPSRS